MDKTAIKNFAVWARKKLIEDIKQKAYEIGITEKEIKEPQVSTSDTMIIGDRTLNKAEMEQRKSLVSNKGKRISNQAGYKRDESKDAAGPFGSKSIGLCGDGCQGALGEI